MASSDDSDDDWRAPGDHREPHRRREFCQPREDEILFSMLSRILTSRKRSGIERLVDTLQAEGIMESCKLAVLSKDFLEQRFGESLTAGEVADLIQVWEALQASKNQSSRRRRNPKGTSKGNSSKCSKGVKSYREETLKHSETELKGARNRSRSPKGGRRPSSLQSPC